MLTEMILEFLIRAFRGQKQSPRPHQRESVSMLMIKEEKALPATA